MNIHELQNGTPSRADASHMGDIAMCKQEAFLLSLTLQRYHFQFRASFAQFAQFAQLLSFI